MVFILSMRLSRSLIRPVKDLTTMFLGPSTNHQAPSLFSINFYHSDLVTQLSSLKSHHSNLVTHKPILDISLFESFCVPVYHLPFQPQPYKQAFCPGEVDAGTCTSFDCDLVAPSDEQVRMFSCPRIAVLRDIEVDNGVVQSGCESNDDCQCDYDRRKVCKLFAYLSRAKSKRSFVSFNPCSRSPLDKKKMVDLRYVVFVSLLHLCSAQTTTTNVPTLPFPS